MVKSRASVSHDGIATLPIHVTLPRLAIDHVLDAMFCGVEDLAVELRRYRVAGEGIIWVADFVCGHDVFLALVTVRVAERWRGHALHVESVAGAGRSERTCHCHWIRGLVPRCDIGDGRRHATVPATGNQGCGLLENGFQSGVDGALDVDGIGGGTGIDKTDIDAERSAEHDPAGTDEVGSCSESFSPEPLPFEDLYKEHDIFPVELHARSVDLEAVIIGFETICERFH